MLKNKRRVAFGPLVVLALLAALLHGGAAQAEGDGVQFVAQTQPAGLSADNAGTRNADPNPAPSTGAATKHTSLTSIPAQGLLAYDCPAGATACFYTGLDGTGTGYAFWTCGFAGLGGLAIMDNVHSVRNQKGVSASLYNWNGK